MAAIKYTVQIKARWWLGPYLLLTRFGQWLGLPLSPSVISRDIERGLKVTFKCVPENSNIASRSSSANPGKMD